MLIRTALAATAALALAAPASAATQLERTLGVEPGVYTTAELARLKSAIAEGDRDAVGFIRSRDGAASRDVATSRLSVADRVVIAVALDENDYDRARFVAQGGLAETADASTTGKAQLAASLGVDPAEYTLAELVDLRRRIEN